MKNLLVLIMMTLMVAACSPTRNELRASRHSEKKSVFTKNEDASPVYYASTKKVIVVGNDYDSLQRRIDQAQQQMFRNIEKDRAASSANLKRSMTTKVYSTTLDVDVKKSAVTVEEDTVYSVKGGGWIVVE